MLPTRTERRPPRHDRLLGQETLQIIGQVRRRGVPSRGILANRCKDDRLERFGHVRIEPARRRGILFSNLAHELLPVLRL